MTAKNPLPFGLLAKSFAGTECPEAATLGGHIRHVVGVCGVLAKEVLAPAVRTLAIDAEDAAVASRILPRAGLLHDLGKANSAFQRVVRKNSGTGQPFRHEVLSAYLLAGRSDFREWLMEGLPAWSAAALIAIVLGHHLKAGDLLEATKPKPGSGLTFVDCYWGHADFAEVLRWFAKEYELAKAPRLEDEQLSLSRNPLSGFCRQLLEWADETEAFDEPKRRALAAMKALLVSADVAGSAIPRSGQDPVRMAGELIGRRCQPESFAAAAAAGMEDKPPRPFQLQVAAAETRVTLVEAGCGNGKTSAAYLWAGARRLPRLFFCYPTTGTATEGFRDYANESFGRNGSALLHSRSEVDLEVLLGTPEEKDAAGCMQRLEALEMWGCPAAVCTVDRVLGLLQNARASLFGSAAILQGAGFVFDEIHLYDDRLFGCLLTFLQSFRGSAVLLMTASLPAPRRTAIENALVGERFGVIGGDERLEVCPRYRFAEEGFDPVNETARTMEACGKVLWVSNQVERCIATGDALVNRGFAPLLYHSRYRYVDRVERHREVISGFQREGWMVACATQVCEVSLNLSADLLITDIAPIPALIQRLGRLNRRAKPDGGTGTRRAIFLEPENAAPYEREQLDAARRWISMLREFDLSQRDLATAFAAMDAGEAPKPVASAWIEGGMTARQEPLREGGYTIPVVRGEDAPACRDQKGRWKRAEVVRYSIPMLVHPVEKELRDWPFGAGAFFAPPGRIAYEERKGARWA